MSLIIKGMSLPSGCNTCQLHVLCFDYYVCRAKKLEREGYLDVDDQVIAGRRHRCCPLVEIPTPHGRLIDADNLIKVLQNTLDNYPDYYNDEKTVEKLIVTVCKRYIESAPTIIEAEGVNE